MEDSRVSIVSLAHLLVVEMPSGSHFRIVFEIRQDLVNVTESQPGDGIGCTIVDGDTSGRRLCERRTREHDIKTPANVPSNGTTALLKMLFEVGIALRAMMGF